jgi:hypothetical protein
MEDFDEQVLARGVPTHPRGGSGHPEGDEDGRNHRLRAQHRQQEAQHHQLQPQAIQRKGRNHVRTCTVTIDYRIGQSCPVQGFCHNPLEVRRYSTSRS